MAQGAHKITEDFEREISKYTGAPYVVCVDNQSNALYMALMYNRVNGKTVRIPKRTYPSVPCEIINAGARVEFVEDHPAVNGEYLTGEYLLEGTNVIDSALWFSADMYKKGTMMCCSFTGAYKHLKLGKGGCILLDDEETYMDMKQFRFSGRKEMSYMEDDLDMLGHNFYMMPEIAARGILMISQFYDRQGKKIHNNRLSLPYPDLSTKEVYKYFMPRIPITSADNVITPLVHFVFIKNEVKVFLNHKDAVKYAEKNNLSVTVKELICSIED